MMTKTALITGASRGLGLALAQALALEGWQLIITGRGEVALMTAADELSAVTTITAVSGDVSDANHRQQLAKAAKQLGGLDVVINNASLLGPSPQPALLDYDLPTLARVFEVNVLAPVGVLQAVHAQLQTNATIINLSSDAAVEPYAGWGGYGASKAALEQLTAVFAAENRDLRVYWVDPGDMRTQMHQEAFPGEDIRDRPLPEAAVPGFLALVKGELPNGRYQAQQMAQEVA